MAKRRDDDNDDFGFRTPTRRPKKSGEKKKTGKTRRAEEPERKKKTGKTKRVEEPERKKKTGQTKGVEEPGSKKQTGRTQRSADTPPRPASKGPPIAIVTGVVVAIGIGGLVALMMLDDDPQKMPEIARKAPEPFVISEGGRAAPPTQEAPAAPPTPVAPPPRVAPPAGDKPVAITPAPTIDPSEDALAELAKKSSTHAAVARILEQFQDLYDPASLHNPGPLLAGFRERQEQEEALLQRLRDMGPGAIDALKDMLLGVDQRQQRIFLGKAIAGIDGPAALAAVKEILGTVKDVALQTTMLRYLPETRDAAETVASLIEGEGNANLRTMLLREFHRRLDESDDSGRDVFRKAALEDPDANVRAEAVTIIGRRGDPRDMKLMEDIITHEKNLSIRQRAIVSYAETGNESSLGFLQDMVRNPDTALPVSASAVLAIGRVGGEQAIQSLDAIAQTHQSQEIRTRANRLAQSLRRRQAEANDPTRVKPTPMRVAPPPVPVRRGG